MMPLANNLQQSPDAAMTVERYPLEVMLCEECYLSQLSVVVDPGVMFSNYNYRSSINQGYRDHCNRMAWDFKTKYNLHTSDKDFGSFIIDIAGNDGALLHEFTKVIPGIKHLNIDPARNLTAANEKLGVRQYTRFWNMETALSLEALGWPKADVITATNVFAHVDNVADFLEAAKITIKDTGVLVLEFPYLVDFIDKGEWDTVYFEHLSYWSITPLIGLCLSLGLHVNDVEKFDIHGGTVRVTISKGGTTSQAVVDMVNHEKTAGYLSMRPYRRYADAVNHAANSFKFGMASITGSVAAFAASAKGNTLLNYIGDNSRIEYIVDETPEKLHKYSPGTGIEVVPLVHLLAFPVDYLIILSWNFAPEIMSRCRAAGYTGSFIIPIPEWKIIE